MPTPGEYKTVQARILAYAQEIGWTYVPRSEAEKRRGFDHSMATPAEQAAAASPYFDDLLHAQVRKLNPKYAEGPGALVGDLRRLHADIAGNRDFLAYLRNARTFYFLGPPESAKGCVGWKSAGPSSSSLARSAVSAMAASRIANRAARSRCTSSSVLGGSLSPAFGSSAIISLIIECSGLVFACHSKSTAPLAIRVNASAGVIANIRSTTAVMLGNCRSSW